MSFHLNKKDDMLILLVGAGLLAVVLYFVFRKSDGGSKGGSGTSNAQLLKEMHDSAELHAQDLVNKTREHCQQMPDKCPEIRSQICNNLDSLATAIKPAIDVLCKKYNLSSSDCEKVEKDQIAVYKSKVAAYAC